MALAQVSPQSVALPRREGRGPARLCAPRLAPWLPLASVLLGIVSLFYLAQTSDLTTTGYSIQELRQEESDWKLRNEQLALEVAKAKSLATVEEQATTRLLMVRPKEVVYLQVQTDNRIARATPASRGETRAAPALEKTVAPPDADRLQPVRDSILGLLAPRRQ
ncbi:MAG: FtsB family cell division protein [Sphingomonadaceae bacterium]